MVPRKRRGLWASKSLARGVGLTSVAVLFALLVLPATSAVEPVSAEEMPVSAVEEELQAAREQAAGVRGEDDDNFHLSDVDAASAMGESPPAPPLMSASQQKSQDQKKLVAREKAAARKAAAAARAAERKAAAKSKTDKEVMDELNVARQDLDGDGCPDSCTSRLVDNGGCEAMARGQSLAAHIPKGLGCEQIECVSGSYEACRTEKNFSAKAMLKDLAFNLNRLKNMHVSDKIGDTQYNEIKKTFEGLEAEVKDEAYRSEQLGGAYAKKKKKAFKRTRPMAEPTRRVLKTDF